MYTPRSTQANENKSNAKEHAQMKGLWPRNKQGNGGQANSKSHLRSNCTLDQLEEAQSILEENGNPAFESRYLCETTFPYLNLGRDEHGINDKILTLKKSKTPAHRLKFGHWRQPRWCMTVRW
jgi:hypothetical protein